MMALLMVRRLLLFTMLVFKVWASYGCGGRQIIVKRAARAPGYIWSGLRRGVLLYTAARDGLCNPLNGAYLCQHHVAKAVQVGRLYDHNDVMRPGNGFCRANTGY